MNRKNIRFMAACLLMFLAPAVWAEWMVIRPEKIQVLPNGNVVFWTITGAAGVNGCGSAATPLRIDVDNYGVTSGAVKLFYSHLISALIAGKSLDVSYYPTNICRVDSVTIGI